MNPNNVYKFVEKLNKVDGNTYTIEEIVEVKNGVYEGELEHDNVSNSSVRVYTGSKLSGEKVDNFILTIPSKMPWKRIIKIFTKASKVYISYETVGDTVEAEDINRLQDGIVNIQSDLYMEIDRASNTEKIISNALNAEIDRAMGSEKVLSDNLNNEINRAKGSETNLENIVKSYKKSNDEEVQKLKDKDSELDLKKADKTYADTELSKRYLKEQVFTKEEVLQKIKDIIGAAPQALDTLQEIAQTLNNDSNFAGTITNKLSEKVDKVLGKQLSTEDYTTIEKQKLSGVEEKANNYIHPQTHDASVIVENINRRFTSDDEKNNWNDAYNKRHDHSNRLILDGITQVLVDKWNTVNSKSDSNHTHSEFSKNGHIHDDRYYTEAEVNSRFVTKEQLGSAGYGDMVKAVYDKDNEGVIDYCKNADMVDGRHGSDFLLKNDNSLSVKVYKNLSSYNNNEANVTGAIIFHTKIPFTACAMLRFHFIGYTYDGNNGLEFVTSGYNYSNNAIHNYGTTYLSSYKPMIRWAKDSSGYLSIIVGDVDTVWQYPKVVIADVIESYNGNESYYSGWTTELATNIVTYEYVTNIPENKTSKTWNGLKGV